MQPRAEFLHGIGPAEVVQWFRSILEAECGPVQLTTSRVDLHADFQGWALSGNDRGRFVCRAKDLATYEEGDAFNGLQFGKRGSQTVSARIYNKTVESAKRGTAYWRDIWGSDYIDGIPVLRVEFEIGRDALRQYGLDTPEDVLAATGALWVSLTGSWLSYRIPTSNGTKSRWPVAPEWEDVCRAMIVDGAFGIERMYAGKRRGELQNLADGLVGYLSSFAALTNCNSFDEVLVATRFEEVAAVLHDLDIVRVWEAAEDRDRRVLIEELLEWVTIFPDHMEVKVVGAPPLNVLYSEVGLKQSQIGGVGEGT